MKKIEVKSLILNQCKTSPTRFEEKVRKFLAFGLDTWVSITRTRTSAWKEFYGEKEKSE